MSSSDPWSCGSRKRRAGECGGLHRIPENRTRCAARGGLPGAGSLAVLVLQVVGWATHIPADRRARLAHAVRKVFDDSSGIYGSPRIGDELREQDWQVSDNTIAVIMAELGLVARAKRRRPEEGRFRTSSASPDPGDGRGPWRWWDGWSWSRAR